MKPVLEKEMTIDGNPLQDITIPEDRRRITHVMKGGQFFRRPAEEVVVSGAIA